MKDDRLWRLKIAATRDLALSDGACRLLFILYQERERAGGPLDAPFPLPWSQVAEWCGCGHDAAYARRRALVAAGYLRALGPRSAPPVGWFALRLEN